MQFYSAYFLNWLWLTPLLAFLFVASSWLTNKRIRSFLKTTEIQNKLLPHYSKNEWPVRATLLLLAFIFSVIALSQPQWGEEKKKIERKGVDVIFMLDVSTSMLAEDTKPSRVQKAKFEIESFIKELQGDRVGMVTFAGTSFMQTPLTLDYSAFLIFLSGVDVGHVPDPGTSLGPAIVKAMEAFPEEKGKHHALIVFSDGEDHEMQLDGAIDIAKKKGVRIYCIGTGTAEGAPIPLKDERGSQTAVKKDRAGNIVITKLNKELLAKAASETGGIYLPATPGEKEIDFILKHLSTLDEKKLEDRTITEREDHYQIFVFLAIACLLLEMLVRRGKSPRMMPLAALIFVFLFNCGFISTPQQKVDEGNEDFEGKKYQSAVQKYREVQVKNPDSPPVEYNLATSLYKVDQFQESAAHLKTAYEKSSRDPVLQAKAAYNYGNALYRVGDYEGAVAAYKKAVELDPKDQDAKYNLEFLLDKKSKFEKENEDRKKNNPEQKKDKDKQDKQKNQQNQGGGSSQDKNQSSGGQKNDKNQGGGGGDKQDKSDGEQNQNQQGSGQKDQNRNQGGQGENKDNSGKNQDPNQKDQGQGQNQQDDKQQGDQSNPNKDPNQKAGGQGEKDQKENQSQDEKNKGDQSGQNQNKDQKDPQQKGGDQQGAQQDKGSDPKSDPKPDQQGKDPNKPDQNQPGQSGGQNQPNQQPKDQKPQDKDPNSQNPGGSQSQQPGQQPKPSDQGQKTAENSGAGAGAQGKSGDKGTQGGAVAGKPLQGQMSKEDAEYLLDSLEDGEKKFHVMRKPATETAEQPYVEKDW